MQRLNRARGRELLDAITRIRALVVGDLMLDEYLFGDVRRISPEAPVPVVRLERESYRLGGAGNVAATASALGATPLLVGLVGRDQAADRFRVELAERGIDSSDLVSTETRPTTLKTRIVAHGQQIVRCDREQSQDATGEVEQALVESCLTRLEQTDVALLSDYAKGGLTNRVVKEVLATCSSHGIPVVADPKVRGFERFQPVTALTPNHHEAAQAAAVYDEQADDESIERTGRRILERQEVRMLLITRGEAGMTLIEREGAVTHLPTVAREVFDVTGAGDTVSATFALALAAGATPVEAADLANHAAGVVVAKIGTATASAEELLQSLPA